MTSVANALTDRSALPWQLKTTEVSKRGQGIETIQPVSSVYCSFNTLNMYPASFKRDKVLIMLTG